MHPLNAWLVQSTPAPDPVECLEALAGQADGVIESGDTLQTGAPLECPERLINLR